jgi:arylformamidase
VSSLKFLSHILTSQTPSYGNRDRFIVKPKSDIRKGDTANTSEWTFTNNHLGTHIDMPRHFCEKGFTYEDYKPEDFVFENVLLIDFPCESGLLICKKDLNPVLPNLNNCNPELLIIRTAYEKYREQDKYWNDNPGLHPELANYFREIFPNIRAVGFDFISITSWNFRQEGRLSHKAFLCPENNTPIWIIEDMALQNVKNELNKVIIAPLLVKDSNGGPVSIIAEEK